MRRSHPSIIEAYAIGADGTRPMQRRISGEISGACAISIFARRESRLPEDALAAHHVH